MTNNNSPKENEKQNSDMRPWFMRTWEKWDLRKRNSCNESWKDFI